MKNLCLQFYSSVFALFVVGFFMVGVNPARAETLFYQVYQGANQGYFNSIPAAEAFEPTDTFNLSSISVFADGDTGLNIKICECHTFSAGTGQSCYSTCLANPLIEFNVQTDGLSGYRWVSLLASTSVLIESGKHYSIVSSGTPHIAYEVPTQGALNPELYAFAYYTGVWNWAPDQSIDIRIYGNPSTYCGDGFCNNGETFGTCPIDCNPAVVFWPSTGYQYGQIGGYWNIPVYFNVCDIYSSIESMTIDGYIDHGEGYFWSQDNYNIEWTLPAGWCSGVVSINFPVHLGLPLVGTSSIILNINYLSTTTISTIYSEPFNYLLGSGISSANYIDSSIVSPLKLDIRQATATLPFFYNATGLAWSGGQICAYNEDTQDVTSFCVSVVASTSIMSMSFPRVSSTTEYYFTGSYRLYSSTGVTLLVSDTFDLIWTWNYASGGYNLGGTAYKDCDIPQFYFTNNTCRGILLEPICNIKYGLMTAGVGLFTPSCGSLNYFQKQYDIFREAFPFNIYFDLMDSINIAIDSASSSTSTPQNVSIPFIKKIGDYGTGSPFYMLPVLSSTSMPSAIGSANTSIFRLSISFILWLLCAVCIYFTVRKI